MSELWFQRKVDDSIEFTEFEDRGGACMLLGTCGDAIGHADKKFEFNRSGRQIHDIVQKMGGVNKLKPSPALGFPLSDDSILAGATAAALLQCRSVEKDSDEAMNIHARQLVMTKKRAPRRCYGPGTSMKLSNLEREMEMSGGKIKNPMFDPRGGGCGGAMRCCCIGLCFPIDTKCDSETSLKTCNAVKSLIRVAVRSARLTHAHPTGYLGAVTAAFFTALAMQRKHPVQSWGRLLLNVAVPYAMEFVKLMYGKDAPDLKASSYFCEKWNAYLKLRGIANHNENKPIFPSKYDVQDRDTFYASVSFSGWGGASGHDAPMIAYDAMLGGGDEKWKVLIERAMLHGGDSDSTGILAGSWYGALNGLRGVPEDHWRNVEFARESMDLGRHLVKSSQTTSSSSFDAAEQHLQQVSRKNAPPMVLALLDQLQEAVVYTDAGNISTNRKLWDNYAKEWNPDREWVKRMAGNLSEDKKKLKHVGDEWSDVKSLNQVIENYIEPFVNSSFDVAEIGSGGGRVTTRVCKLTDAPKSIHCFDISKEMLKRAHEAVCAISTKVDVKYCLLKEDKSLEKFSSSFDFVYSFDVFVHMDLHTIWKYLNHIKVMLRPKGRAFVSTSNLMAPLGWKRFSKQKKFSVGGFYFVTPDLVRHLIHKSGLKIVKESKIDASNLYYNRDYLVVLERKDEV